MHDQRPHTRLENGVSADLCGAWRRGESGPCRTPREKCTRHCGADLRTRAGHRCPNAQMPNGRCRMHGGRSLRGVAHPSFREGRYSKSVPARLSQSYEETLNDPRKLELSNELAVLVARNREMLSSLYSGESDGLWMRLRNEKRVMEEARRRAEVARREGDADAELRYTTLQAEHFNALLRLVEAGAKDGERWAELMRNVDTQRKLAESDRKRRVEEHQVATTEEILAIMGAVLAIICRHVTD